MLNSGGDSDDDLGGEVEPTSQDPTYVMQETSSPAQKSLNNSAPFVFPDEELDSPLLLSDTEVSLDETDGFFTTVSQNNKSRTYQKLLRKLQKAATNLRFARKWLIKVIMAQTVGNLVRALPVFILEKYYIMLIVFFQGIFLACGYYGVKQMRPILILVYALGCFGITIADATMASTYAQPSAALPLARAIESNAVFVLYILMMCLICLLNVFGGCFLGLRMCVSVTLLKNPKERSLVLLAASWIGSFDNTAEDDEKKKTKVKRRVIHVNAAGTQQEQQFCSNVVKTSKYNVATFIPKILYMQFSRLANLYTLMVVILCMFSFSPVGPASSLTPLVVVLCVSGIKEFLEDVRRHRQDAMVNGRATQILDPQAQTFLPKKWLDVRVGDIIMVKKDDLIPADLLLLSSSRPDGRCYLETANLDGETNLKVRVQLPQFAGIQSVHDLTSLMSSEFSLECEPPSNNIYSFDGVLTLKSPVSGSSAPPSAPRSAAATPKTSPKQSPRVPRSKEGAATLAREDSAAFARDNSNAMLLSSELMQSMGSRAKGSRPGTPLGRSLSLSRSSTISKFDTQTLAVTGDMLLQRGTTLRNTEFVYGLPVYTGVDTKVEQNALVAPLKRSSMERSVNTKLLLLFLLQTVICIICSIGHNRWYLTKNVAKPWYLDEPPVEFIYISYVILYNTMIPLSMYVSMEMVRVANAASLGRDENISQATCRTTNIVEELGQVKYLFADKTGTLTCNEMVVRQLSISGLTHSVPTPLPTDDAHVIGTLLVMALCNTVQVEEEKQAGDSTESTNDSSSSSKKYSAASPDEEALVLAAGSYGIVLDSRENNLVHITVHGELHTYEVLQVLEFNSFRKRMSVIVRNTSTGEITLLCKGADSVIFDRLQRTEDIEAIKHTTADHLNSFASSGLRTLLLASKTIESTEYEAWCKLYHEASIALSERQAKIDTVSDQIEKGLELQGAAGIEDCLQEGVADCVTSLREAGMRVWVLTGDKTETAIAVASQAGVIGQGMEVVVLNETTEEELLARLTALSDRLGLVPQLPPTVAALVGFLGFDVLGLPSFLRPSPPPDIPLAIVVAEQALSIAVTNRVRYHFLGVAKAAAAVVCSRCSPLHKAKVVKLVAEKSFLFGDGAVTLAIGDGANDVPMIRLAHIGVGIGGREGMQAVLSSDFSINQFSHLKRLLLIHGARCHKRIAKLIFYSFCKNLTLCLSQFWFGFSNAFSGQMMYFDFLFTLYNALFTSLPILVISSNDEEHSDKVLMNNPGLYKYTQSNINFSTIKFIGWIGNGVWQSSVIFFLTFMTLGEATSSMWVLGTTTYTCLVLAMTAQVSLITSSWKLPNFGTVAGSVVLYFVFIAVYCAIFSNGIGVMGQMLAMPLFWFAIIVVPFISVLPYWLYMCLRLFLGKSAAPQPTSRHVEFTDDDTELSGKYEL